MVEDFAPREPRFIWAVFEWLLQRIDGNSVHAYTLTEARSLCEQAGLHVVSVKEFTVDWLWRGWVVRAYSTASEARPART